jgi:2-keto-4-pentenoate hydratase/2-oxohepta-3-ene-1,7-dioic acid hydratase in catechol pathway
MSVIWNVPRLAEYASHVMTLNSGDFLPPGPWTAWGRSSPGDQVTMEVERVGRLSVRVELRKP